MRKRLAGLCTASMLLTVAALILTACGPRPVVVNDLLEVPTAREVSNRLVNATVGRLAVAVAPAVTDKASESWLAPTPTPVDASLFDKVFGMVRAEMAAPEAAQPRQETWGTVAAPSLNVRSGPGTEHPVIAALTAGERLQIAEQTAGWVRFLLPDGRTGWSSADYVNAEDPAAALTQPAAAPVAVPVAAAAKALVLADVLNVRDRPDLSGAVIASLGRQECVDMLGRQNGWVHVSLTAVKTGWCHGDFVQAVEFCPTPAPADPYAIGGVAGAQTIAQTVAASPMPALPVAASPQLVPNGSVIMSTSLHECFGGGYDELRYVRAGTPVQALGVGPFTPPPGQADDLGPGPYAKIRLWDGQYAWIAAAAVGVDPATAAQLSGQCEPGDRIDWSLIATLAPTATPRPQDNPQLRETATPRVTPTATHTHKKRDE